MKRHSVLALAGAILALTGLSITVAESQDPTAPRKNRIKGWYLGAGGAVTNVFAQLDVGLIGSAERGRSDTGFVINGGYRFMRFLAVEVGYLEGQV